MTVPAKFKKVAIVGIMALSAAGLSACSDNRNCVPNASGTTTVERVSEVDAALPMKGGGGGGRSSSGGTRSNSGSKTTNGSTSQSGGIKRGNKSSSGGWWFFGGSSSSTRTCPAGYVLR